MCQAWLNQVSWSLFLKTFQPNFIICNTNTIIPNTISKPIFSVDIYLRQHVKSILIYKINIMIYDQNTRIYPCFIHQILMLTFDWMVKVYSGVRMKTKICNMLGNCQNKSLRWGKASCCCCSCNKRRCSQYMSTKIFRVAGEQN